MAADKTGGPAFPGGVAIGPSGEVIPAMMHGIPEGMSLRDYFACTAVVNLDEYTAQYAIAFIGRPMPDYTVDPVGNATFWAEFRAAMRFIEVDAMLRKRAK
ncbi:hypothetical protein [Herbaspirillum huttiense]|uniref:hypothetical protein n=1 Tax=Herbaspirillum huttiense TaxID=863372 RepID=UPI0031DBB329